MGSREPDLRRQDPEQGNADVRRAVAQALARAQCTILMMRSTDIDLEGHLHPGHAGGG